MSVLRMTYAQSLTYPGQEGDVANIIMEDGSLRPAIFRNGEFLFMSNKVEANDEGLSLNLYDLNKQVVGQLPCLDVDGLKAAVEVINNFHKEKNNCFYMLYGKEISYFTLFQNNITQAEADLGTEVINCASAVGMIVSIEPTEDKSAIEVWVKQEDDATCMYLFPYDKGVVPYGNN